MVPFFVFAGQEMGSFDGWLVAWEMCVQTFWRVTSASNGENSSRTPCGPKGVEAFATATRLMAPEMSR